MNDDPDASAAVNDADVTTPPAGRSPRPRVRRASTSTERRKGRKSLAEGAYANLRARILDNRMMPGDQFTEGELASILNMSRTPIREAMLRLASEGLVEVRPRHGMRVKPISVTDMREIYDVLMALESEAAALAALREDRGDAIERMREAIRDMDRALERDDRKAWAAADERFHMLLVEAGGNSRIRDLVQTFVGQSHRVRMLTLSLRPLPTASTRDHEAVVDAVAARDPERARHIHHEHRRTSGQLLVDLLAHHGLIRL
ncbi:MAG: GntR family transcriptional regulator [Rhodoplanes sp.]|uniref:GntR family transcriptional regulator n=1 Tax=Rhodoplanes sp. TaxID=1968906 RepID=UPI0017B98B61|nr:GntR family transcriptional regulator [Rhodoplanes sp.]NVO17496.1 GntR family transcriptional regulator [Rhodoplanes sp.]